MEKDQENGGRETLEEQSLPHVLVITVLHLVWVLRALRTFSKYSNNHPSYYPIQSYPIQSNTIIYVSLYLGDLTVICFPKI